MKKILFSLLAGCILMSGCDDRREILEDNTVWVRVKLDWAQAGNPPNGVTVWFFPTRTDSKPIVLRTNSTMDSIKLRRDIYSVLVFNDTEKDHDGMAFRNTERYETFEAYATPYKDNNKVVVKADDEVVAQLPGDLTVASNDRFEVTWDMVGRDQRPLLQFAPKSKLYTLKVSVRIKGLDNVVAGSTGTLSGLAEGLLLARSQRSTQKVTHQFLFDKLRFDEGSYQQGTIYAHFQLFGLADGDITRQDEKAHKLKLYLRLRDGSVYTVERDVSQLIKENTEGTLELDLTVGSDKEETGENPIVKIPDVKPSDPDAGSGFDADVSEWGDKVEIEIPLK